MLYSSTGKDLSKISMPVSMNEPLSALQRLCEELEYSQLLDQAASCQDPFDRMVYVACFAVSSYALSYYRAGRKPFNPILGETYEFIQENIGLKFIAEQVERSYIRTSLDLPLKFSQLVTSRSDFKPPKNGLLQD